MNLKKPNIFLFRINQRLKSYEIATLVALNCDLSLKKHVEVAFKKSIFVRSQPHLETDTKITTKEAEKILAKAPGVKLITGPYPYATPVREAAGCDLVYVGRVREDISHERGLNLWIVADNLRKGAALNAVQIAEHLMKIM